MSTTFSWGNGTTSSPTETVTGTDNVGNTNSGTQLTFVNDSTAPVNDLSLSGQSGGGSFLSGTTVYYHGSTAGSFTLTNALTDSGSGPASSTFPTLGGATSGWSHTASTDTTSPYVSTTFNWGNGTTSSPTETVTGTDNAGNTVTTTLTFVNDSTAPVNDLSLSGQSGGGSFLSGTTVYYHGSTAGSFTITNALTDSGSGPASSTFASLGGSKTGWSFTTSTVSSPTGGPYVSTTFNWGNGTTSSTDRDSHRHRQRRQHGHDHADLRERLHGAREQPVPERSERWRLVPLGHHRLLPGLHRGLLHPHQRLDRLWLRPGLEHLPDPWWGHERLEPHGQHRHHFALRVDHL